MGFSRITAAIVVAVFLTSNAAYATPPQLRGKLGKDATGAYVVEQVGTNISSPYFNFMTRKPEGYVTGNYGCTSALWYFANGGAKCSNLNREFTTFSTNWGTTLLINTIGQVFLLAPLVTGGVIVDRTASFDSRNYESAVNSAMAKISAATISERYLEVAAKIENTVKEHNNWSIAKFDQIKEKHKIVQKQNRKKLTIKTVVEDQTGFWESRDLPKLPVVDSDLHNRTSKIDFQFNGVDATSPDSFLVVLAEIEKKLDATVAEGKTKALADAAAYDDELGKISSTINLPHQETYKIDGFTIKVKAPSKIVLSPEVNSLTAKYTIEGKDWLNVIPNFSNSDENIRIDLNSGFIRVVNKTSRYVTISSLTAYYNSEVNNFECDLELPPETYKDVPASNVLGSDSIKKVASYYNIDKAKAASSYFTFGMAAKYRLVDKNQEKSLYKTNKYNLSKVINDLK